MASEITPGPLFLPWRTGRHVGRTVYAQAGGEASGSDLLIGVMDTPELATEACEAHNYLLWQAQGAPLNVVIGGEPADEKVQKRP